MFGFYREMEEKWKKTIANSLVIRLLICSKTLANSLIKSIAPNNDYDERKKKSVQNGAFFISTPFCQSMMLASDWARLLCGWIARPIIYLLIYSLFSDERQSI